MPRQFLFLFFWNQKFVIDAFSGGNLCFTSSRCQKISGSEANRAWETSSALSVHIHHSHETCQIFFSRTSFPYEINPFIRACITTIGLFDASSINCCLLSGDFQSLFPTTQSHYQIDSRSPFVFISFSPLRKTGRCNETTFFFYNIYDGIDVAWIMVLYRSAKVLT